jgi:hypothetical protein
MNLERRYRRLLRAYPPTYRAERGEEIVSTYLELAGPGQDWPSVGDAADALPGGIRQRLRAKGALGSSSWWPPQRPCFICCLGELTGCHWIRPA